MANGQTDSMVTHGGSSGTRSRRSSQVRWEGTERKNISLPTPANRHLWFGEDPACPLCASLATLKHILRGCNVSMTQGKYTWRHNQVLKCLASASEKRRTTINAIPTTAQPIFPETTFIRKGVKQWTNASPSDTNWTEPPDADRDW